MFTAPIQDILAGKLQHVPLLVAENTLRQDIDELIAVHLHAGRVAVVDDLDTANAYGDVVARALMGRFETTHITLPRGSEADEISLSEIERRSAKADLLVAVGSGTINDLVKLTAHRAKKPYVIFATAASMNGYVSHTASIRLHGHKQSIMASLPQAVFLDLQIIADAPHRLAQAGIGDSLARPTAQADWLLAHHLLNVPYDDTPYQLIGPYEKPVFEQIDAIRKGDREAVLALMKLLLVSGFGMTIAGSSTPASGSEHMLAHAYGMSALPSHRNLHGEEIALTSLVASARYEKLLHAKPSLAAMDWPPSMQEIFGEATALSLRPGYEKKRAMIIDTYPDGRLNQRQWDQAREAISSIWMPPSQLEALVSRAGLADRAEKLGWSKEAFARISDVARFTRDRFTCLDLA